MLLMVFDMIFAMNIIDNLIYILVFKSKYILKQD